MPGSTGHIIWGSYLWVADVVPVMQTGRQESLLVKPILSLQQFALVLQQLDDARFDDERRAMAVHVFNQYIPTCSQVRAMLEEIPFDDTREMVTKVAWHAVFDPD